MTRLAERTSWCAAICGSLIRRGEPYEMVTTAGGQPPDYLHPGCVDAYEVRMRTQQKTRVQNAAESRAIDFVEATCERCGRRYANPLALWPSDPDPCRKQVPGGTCGGQLVQGDDDTVTPPEPGPAPALPDGDPAGSSEETASPARSLFEDQLRRLSRPADRADDADTDAHATDSEDAGGGGGGVRGGAPGDPIPPGGEGRQS